MTNLQPRIVEHAAESGHWYDRAGNQIAEVPNAKGDKFIKCTLRQARNLDLAPGCTTIIKQCDKPALTRWMVEQGIMAALTLPRLPDESEKDWLARVDRDRQESAKAAAEEGTRVHAAIQSAIEGDEYDPAYEPHVRGISAILDGLSGEWLIDFKGKDGDLAALRRLKPYDEHAMQLAATLQALEDCDASTGGAWMPEVPCVSLWGYGTKADLIRIEDFTDYRSVRTGILFFSRDYPGDAALAEVTSAERSKGMAMFLGLLRYWQAKNDYRPSWAEVV